VSEAKRVVIVGVGLIGGSVGLALKQQGWEVVGVDVDAERLKRALELNAIDSVATIDQAGPCQLAVVATPVDHVVGTVERLLAAGAEVVTDVGSVKGPVASAIDDHRFVAGHPMAGSEQDGIDGATPLLFSGATWVLCPTAKTDDDVFVTVRDVVVGFGANPIAMEPDRHDQLVAVVSHVPHLTAATLMGLADGRAVEHRALLRLAAGGFRDMTRIAAGHPAIWPDICVQNADAIVDVLDQLIAELFDVRTVVAGRDRQGLLQRLETARSARRNLPTTAPSTDAMSEMRVPIQDRRGELATLVALAAELDVNIYDLEIAHSTEGPRGVAVLIIETAVADRLLTGLIDRGYRPSLRAIDS